MTVRGPRRRGIVSLTLVALALVAAVVLFLVRDAGSHDAGSRDAEASSSSAADPAASITDPDAANAFLAGATTDIVAVTTYDYRTLDTTLQNGSTVSTGAYRRAFRASLTGAFGDRARQAHRVQGFDVLKAGIGAIEKTGSNAKVLIFGVQSITDDTTQGKPVDSLVTLTATVERRGNRYLLSELSAGRNAGLPPGTAGLRAAAEAGRSEVEAVLTLRHDHFDTDYAQAVDGAVQPLRARLSDQAASARKRVTTGAYDLAGAVTAVAVEQAGGNSLVLLIAATGTRTDADGTSKVVSEGRYEVTVVRVGDAWRTSSIDSVESD